MGLDIEKLLKKENIIFDMEVMNKEQVISELSEKLYENEYLYEKEGFIKDVNQREEMMSTGIGKGIAIPHGKSKYVKKATVALAKLKKGVYWESLDEEEIKIIFLLAVPEEKNNLEHLKILAMLSERLMDDEFVEAIKNSNSIDELYKKVRE